MKAADLSKAALIADAREKNIAIRDRLAAGERLTLSLGDGGTAQTIVLMPAYAARIRADLLAAFDMRIFENEQALAELGITP
ncbi:hypothetical protein P9279_22005 [Mesorhizobium sp. WSM4962]|uniref:hypothetical protein n=1 Tax=Mesorhizobium sp. WSM4962 TaxID=3038548 RepID=UPI002417011B|nr:hypothetical protein [Mesorhizobium sp. WSM4962]MDG4903187.1 hypothetical protein [Mesorhizobium sp. WSM4962]